MNNLMIDIHTHIQQHDPAELDGMLERAVEAGVGAIIAAGTTVEDTRDASDLARKYEMVFAGVGVHPSELKAPLAPNDLNSLEEMAGDGSTVVMSEVGIDFMPNSPDRSWQEEAFEAQIEIAKNHDLPVVFHVREELDDLGRFDARGCALSILRESDAGQLGGAAHYFQGDWGYARKVLELGFMISLAKPLLRSRVLQEVAAKAPLEMIVLETDSYPQPFKKNRARWTEPKDVLEVAECLARIKGVSIDDVVGSTTKNALNLLRTRAAALELQLSK